jgi:hypothetical protein
VSERNAVVTVELLHLRALDEGGLPVRDAVLTTVAWWLSGRILRV